MKNKTLNAILLSLLYVVAFFVGELLGFLHPFLWVYFALPVAILAAYPYIKLCKKHQVFGISLLPVGMLLLIYLLMGEVNKENPQFPIIAGLLACVAELLRRYAGGYGNIKSTILSYCAIALVPFGSTSIMWFRPQYAMGVTLAEMGPKYAASMHKIIEPWILVVMIIVVIAVAYLSASFVAKKCK